MRPLLLTLLIALIPTVFAIAETPATRPAATRPEDLVLVRKGTIPVIISAPHGGTEAIPGLTDVRKGGGVAKFVAGRDDNTDLLAERLADAVEKRLGGKPYVVIAHFARKYADANRPANDAYESPLAAPYYDAYHAALERACRQVEKDFGGGLLIDVHGQGATPDAIYRGTRNGNTVSAITQKSGRDAIVGPHGVFGYLELSNRYKILPAAADEAAKEDPRFNGGYIVATYSSSAITAMQMEFGMDFRRKDHLDCTATDVADAIAAFVKRYLTPEKP